MMGSDGGGTAVLLDVRNVSKHFGGIPTNDRISLQVQSGEIVGLIGPNGSGKTTLFNAITGHCRVDSGAVRFNGRNIIGLSVQSIARIGILRTFQQTRIYRQMTGLENVWISLPGVRLRRRDLAWPLPRDAKSRARELLDFVGLQGRHDGLAGQMSFGQQRLLELAMVLMSRPTLLLLDEPTAGLAPAAIEGLTSCLRLVNRTMGTSLLVIEHNLPVIMGLADRIYCLSRGKVLAEGTPARIQNDQRVFDAYLGAR
jgi:ABC-type branched-subunit amino acid transport system ATPase component